jgi:hypothetical protein
MYLNRRIASDLGAQKVRRKAELIRDNNFIVSSLKLSIITFGAIDGYILWKKYVLCPFSTMCQS